MSVLPRYLMNRMNKINPVEGEVKIGVNKPLQAMLDELKAGFEGLAFVLTVGI